MVRRSTSLARCRRILFFNRWETAGFRFAMSILPASTPRESRTIASRFTPCRGWTSDPPPVIVFRPVVAARAGATASFVVRRHDRNSGQHGGRHGIGRAERFRRNAVSSPQFRYGHGGPYRSKDFGSNYAISNFRIAFAARAARAGIGG